MGRCDQHLTIANPRFKQLLCMHVPQSCFCVFGRTYLSFTKM